MSRKTLNTMSTDHIWAQQRQGQIEGHVTWKGDLQEDKSETLLKNEPSFSYILRKGEGEYVYFITYVKSDGSIKHQRFVLEIDQKGWYYRNGVTKNSPAEILADTVEELIPLMMHCEPKDCIPFTSSVR